MSILGVVNLPSDLRRIYVVAVNVFGVIALVACLDLLGPLVR